MLPLRNLFALIASCLTMAGVFCFISARLVSDMLFEVRPYDAATYAGVILSLGLLSLLATYLPARRATQIDPLIVLRQA